MFCILGFQLGSKSDFNVVADGALDIQESSFLFLRWLNTSPPFKPVTGSESHQPYRTPKPARVSNRAAQPLMRTIHTILRLEAIEVTRGSSLTFSPICHDEGIMFSNSENGRCSWCFSWCCLWILQPLKDGGLLHKPKMKPFRRWRSADWGNPSFPSKVWKVTGSTGGVNHAGTEPLKNFKKVIWYNDSIQL